MKKKTPLIKQQSSKIIPRKNKERKVAEIEKDIKIYTQKPHSDYVLETSKKLMKEGKSQTYVAEFLSAHGYRTRSGEKLSQPTLSRFLISHGVRQLWQPSARKEESSFNGNGQYKQELTTLADKLQFILSSPLDKESKNAIIALLAEMHSRNK